MKRCLVTQAYYDANKDLIHGLATAAGVGTCNFMKEGVLVSCRGINPADLPAADIFTLPTQLPDEAQADYRSRIAAAAVGAYNAVKNGPKEVFFIEAEHNLFDCRAAGSWPQPPQE